MHKFFLRFTFLTLLLVPLAAKEPFIATLLSINSNDTQLFQYGNNKFICKTYGVLSIDEIYRNTEEKSVCRKSITTFYTKQKDLVHYTQSKLNVYQSYSLVVKNNNRCLINISGEKTLSEFLLEEGLAVMQDNFRDKEYRNYFYKSEQKAKVNLKGVWKDNMMKDCAAYISTLE